MPASATSRALLLRAVKYGEADQVLTLYTRHAGKISCIAKNSRQSRQRFGSALQPFCSFEAKFRPRPHGLAFLESAMPLQSHPGLLCDLERMGAGYRLLELADLLEENGSVHTDFFDALELGLASVSTAESTEDAALRSEANLLALAGWAPRLDACVACQREAPFSSPRLSLSEGGLLCPGCRSDESALSLAAGAGKSLQRLFAGLPGSVIEARAPLRRFVEYQLGKALKSDAFERSIRSLA